MSEVKVSQSHSVGVEAACSKMKELEPVVGKYGVRVIWSGNRADLKGIGVNGTIMVDATSVEVAVKLGAFTKMFAKPLEEMLRKRLEAAFAQSA